MKDLRAKIEALERYANRRGEHDYVELAEVLRLLDAATPALPADQLEALTLATIDFGNLAYSDGREGLSPWSERWHKLENRIIALAAQAVESSTAEPSRPLVHSTESDSKSPEAAIECIWECKVGALVPGGIQGGADFPMRRAVEAAFRHVTGVDDQFMFTGWAGSLTESERAVVENRMPRPAASGNTAIDRSDSPESLWTGAPLLSDELLPCPFCGGPGELLQRWAGGDTRNYTVECRWCDSAIGEVGEREFAAKKWNGRAVIAAHQQPK